MEEFLIFLAIGFFAQIIDGALGMAYGLITTTSLLSLGFPPVNASAITHAAECITTGFSAFAHHKLGNIDRKLFLKLLVPGIFGAVTGVYILTNVDVSIIKPIIAIYLLIMGIIVMSKAFTVFPPRTITSHLIPLGFGGGLMDAVGGGGWGPIVTSTLLARGHHATKTIGTVNALEVFIAVTITLAFFFNNVMIGWYTVVGLAIGGAIAAPFAAYACKYVPVKILLFSVGLLIIGLSFRTFWISFLKYYF